MNIGIIGTRGIPNQYGGFEQFAEYVAPALVQRGHEVTVYNSSSHPYTEKMWRGVRLINQFDPENKIGTAGQFIYDLNCIMDSRKRNFDIILQLGYTSSSVWGFLVPRSSILITNMDGLEWKRSKYSKPVQLFLKRAEKWAARRSQQLIADSKGIQEYLLRKYERSSTYIAYGAELFSDPDEKIVAVHGIEPYAYHLVIARMEPENNIELILQGHIQSGTNKKLILVGNWRNKFGSYLKKKYETPGTIFWGPAYDLNLLNNLRHFSHFYFHGHSVGGTNPSLLEAMASNALIIANDNIFNRAILEEDAFYFKTADDISAILTNNSSKDQFNAYIQHNRQKIEMNFSWPRIIDQLETLFTKSLYG